MCSAASIYKMKVPKIAIWKFKCYSIARMLLKAPMTCWNNTGLFTLYGSTPAVLSLPFLSEVAVALLYKETNTASAQLLSLLKELWL